MRGRPPKPRHLKVIAGTDAPYRRQEPRLELAVLSEVPEPPDWLPNAHAVSEWNRLAPVLVNNGLLTEAGLSAFGHLCALHGKIVQLWSAGIVPTGHLYAQLRGLVSDFALTPIAAARVKVEGPKAANPYAIRGNPFAANRPDKPGGG